jgi:hypothetical protein
VRADLVLTVDRVCCSAIHTREEERMRQLNRSTELYFNGKPLRTLLLSQEAELASVHDRSTSR